MTRAARRRDSSIAHVNQLRLLIGAARRSQLRWAGEHLYYWLVLGPLVIGFTTLTIARLPGIS